MAPSMADPSVFAMSKAMGGHVAINGFYVTEVGSMVNIITGSVIK